MIDPDVLADIYEAGAIPSRWPSVLDRVAKSLDARGGNLIRNGDRGLVLQSSEGIAEVSAEFERLGWNRDNSRVQRLIERQPYAGFLTDSDLHSDEELAHLPMYAEFLNPRGAAAGSGTIIQGSGHDALIVAIEGFPDHAASRAASTYLDALRPHLARAATLSARVEEERRRLAVDLLEMIGVPAALLDQTGRARRVNAAFSKFVGTFVWDRRERLELAHPVANRMLTEALDRLRVLGVGSSLPLRNAEGRARAALHLLPVAGEARDLFVGVAAIGIIADAENRRTPAADLLQALFDLTPTEARVARHVVGGAAPDRIARELGCSVATVRTHLQRVFLKTGASRQSDLAVLLGGFATLQCD